MQDPPSRLFCLLAFAVLAVPACRTPGEPRPSASDAPGREMDWTLGTWQGVRRSGATGEAEPMVMRVAEILNGAGQTREMEIVDADGGDVYRGFCAQVFDAKRGIWVREYTNESRGRFTELEGETLPGDDSRSVWRVTAPRTRETELISERPSPDAWVRTMTISEDGGGTWSVLWIDELVRKR